MMKSKCSACSKSVCHSSSVNTRPVGFPGKQTYMSCVRPHWSSVSEERSRVNLVAATWFRNTGSAPASSVAPSQI